MASTHCDKMIYAFLNDIGPGSHVLDPPHQSDNEDKCIQGDGIERARAIYVLQETIYCIRNSGTG